MSNRSLRVALLSLLSALVFACGGKQQGSDNTLSHEDKTPAGSSEVAGARAATRPVPPGFFTITPGLMVEDVDAAINFYTEAFGASTQLKIPGPDGKTEHAEIKIGDSVVMLARYHAGKDSGSMKPPKALGGSPGSLNLYVEDSDATVKRALVAGATAMMPVENQFWGDRWGMVQDPFGHQWGVGTAKVKLGDAQIRQLGEIAFQPGAQAKIEAAWKSAPKAEGYKQKEYHDITPSLTLRDAEKVLDFYSKGLAAQQRQAFKMPNGKLMHAEFKVGDSIVMASEEFPEFGNKSPLALDGTTFFLYVYLPEVDKATAQAKSAGAKKVEGPTDMFWGDRISLVTDPSGHVWSLATHQRDVSPEEMKKAMESFGGPEGKHEHKH